MLGRKSKASLETSEPTSEEVKAAPEGEESFLRFFASLVFYTLFTLAAVGIAAASVGSALGYYRIETVLSGSMRPDYPPGSVVVAFSKPADTVHPGDVIIFRSPENYGGETVTHRVVSARIADTGDVYVRTKGDNNNVADPWDARITSSDVWKVRKGIPYVGYVAYYAKQWWPLLLALGLAFPMMGFANQRVRDAYGRDRLLRRNKPAVVEEAPVLEEESARG